MPRAARLALASAASSGKISSVRTRAPAARRQARDESGARADLEHTLTGGELQRLQQPPHDARPQHVLPARQRHLGIGVGAEALRPRARTAPAAPGAGSRARARPGHPRRAPAVRSSAHGRRPSAYLHSSDLTYCGRSERPQKVKGFPPPCQAGLRRDMVKCRRGVAAPRYACLGLRSAGTRSQTRAPHGRARNPGGRPEKNQMLPIVGLLCLLFALVAALLLGCSMGFSAVSCRACASCPSSCSASPSAAGSRAASSSPSDKPEVAALVTAVNHLLTRAAPGDAAEAVTRRSCSPISAIASTRRCWCTATSSCTPTGSSPASWASIGSS